jgi:hypothetical protein
MKITKSELEVMMQEEAGKLTPRTDITSSEIKKMMQEEYKNIQENDIDLWSDDNPEQEADPRAQAFKQALAALGDLQYDSLEDKVASYAKEAVGALTKAVEELDYNRNQVGNDPEADAARTPLDSDGYPMRESRPMREARKRALKRDREKFANNTDMVSGLQKTITSYLKETGAKLDVRHSEIIERMSTRLMHVANNPMIKLSEGDATSRMITKLEDVGKIIQDALQYSENPESTERLERADQMVTELFDEMHNLL